jgi:hypothetical protein
MDASAKVSSSMTPPFALPGVGGGGEQFLKP